MTNQPLLAKFVTDYRSLKAVLALAKGKTFVIDWETYCNLYAEFHPQTMVPRPIRTSKLNKNWLKISENSTILYKGFPGQGHSGVSICIGPWIKELK